MAKIMKVSYTPIRPPHTQISVLFKSFLPHCFRFALAFLEVGMQSDQGTQ